MERSASGVVLDVRGRPFLNEQFHAESSVVGEGSVMESRLALVVLSTDRYLAVEESIHHHILSITTGNVEWGTPMTVDRIRLGRER